MKAELRFTNDQPNPGTAVPAPGMTLRLEWTAEDGVVCRESFTLPNEGTVIIEVVDAPQAA